MHGGEEVALTLSRLTTVEYSLTSRLCGVVGPPPPRKESVSDTLYSYSLYILNNNINNERARESRRISIRKRPRPDTRPDGATRGGMRMVRGGRAGPGGVFSRIIGLDIANGSAGHHDLFRGRYIPLSALAVSYVPFVRYNAYAYA